MQFKAIFEGVWRKEFENYKIEIKNNRGSEKKTLFLQKKACIASRQSVAVEIIEGYYHTSRRVTTIQAFDWFIVGQNWFLLMFESNGNVGCLYLCG